MSKIIVYKIDNKVCSISPAYNSKSESETEKQFLDRIIETEVPNNAECFTIDDSLLPNTTIENCIIDWNNKIISIDNSSIIADAIAAKIAQAWKTCSDKIATGIVSVTTSAGTHNYGIDTITQDNISKVMIGVLAGIVPNPRPWTPKEVLEPVYLTHDDLKLVGATILARVDSLVQFYLAHKKNISTLTMIDEVESYDLTSGWV